MTHTIREKQKLLARVRRIRGPRGAMAGLMAEVVEDHVRTHLVDADHHPGALNAEATEQLLEVVRTYLK
jgi:FrmR/RcnR family transcriptional regulator, repressor of frmRAB operon